MTNLQELTSRLPNIRTRGRLYNPNPYDLTLTGRPANKEAILMTKNAADPAAVTVDFSKASDQAKNAVALSYEAVKSVMDSLPPEIVQFYKAAAEELDLDKPETSPKPDPEGDDSEDKKEANDTSAEDLKQIEMVKSALPGVIEKAQAAAIAPIMVDLKKTQDEVKVLTDLRYGDTMRDVASTLTLDDNAVPTDEQVEQLTLISKSMTPAQFDKYLEGRRSEVAMVKNSALLTRVSNPSAPTVSSSAHGQLQEIANSIMAKSEVKDQGKAFSDACESNPRLYAQYREEQSKQSVGSVS